MANIKFSRKIFEKEIGKLTEEMQQKIAMFGTTLESFNEEEIELEIFPNRPDLLSYQGFKRSFVSFLGKKTKGYKVNKPEKNYTVKVEKSVKNVRPFTACAIVKNLNFDDEKIKEIIDIQEKLHTTVGRKRKKLAIGIYPLEKIKLPISYKAEEPGKIKFIPLEMNKELTGKQILSQHPAGRDYGYLLEGRKKYPVFRDSAGEVLSMPPIINSELTGKITDKTKDVFIECSGFDLEILKKTLNILVTELADMQGEIYQMNLDYGNKITTPDLEPEKTKINLDDMNKLLGLELKENEVKKLLEKMGHSYNKGVVEVPAYRTDILHPVDIYEDIAIAYGYDKFVPEIPEISTIGQEQETEIKKRKIADVLTGLGLLELSTYHLTTKKDIKKTGIKGKITEVLESKTDFSVLRPSLLVNSLKVLNENSNARYPQKLFEMGGVFETNGEKIKEKDKLCIAISGETDFTEIKQTLDYLMRMLNVECKIEETEHPAFIPGRCGKIIVKLEREEKGTEKEIGILGEISPNVIKNWHLKMPVVALEIEIEDI